jgi:ubiquinone/menaquinone biosynthesis C-methylase UbiE
MIDQTTHTRLNQEKFDSWAPTYEEGRYDFFRRMQERVLAQFDLKDGMNLLDIGCGTGWAVRRSAVLVGPRGKACGVDLSAKMIEHARKAAAGMPNAEFQQGSAEELPFANGSFDCVLSTMSFHHWLHPSVGVRELARVLKPRGRVCIVDPTADNLFMRLADAFIRRRQPDHVKMYSSIEFREFFEAAGLRYRGSGRIMVLWLTARAHFAESMAS